MKILNAPQLSLLREKLKLKFRMKQKSVHHQKTTSGKESAFTQVFVLGAWEGRRNQR